MNVPAAIIATGLGVAFFAAELVFYFQPAWINADYVMGMVMSPQHTKAKAAVSRLLVDPESAEFSSLRSVEADKAKFVCGAVKAKDRAGYYAAYREFVYTVAIDAARIDDDGWIAQKHAAFRPCPVAPEEKPQNAPEAMTMAKAIEKVVPAAVNSGLSTIASKMPAGGGGGSGGSLEQQAAHGKPDDRRPAAGEPAWFGKAARFGQQVRFDSQLRFDGGAAGQFDVQGRTRQRERMAQRPAAGRMADISFRSSAGEVGAEADHGSGARAGEGYRGALGASAKWQRQGPSLA